MNVGLLAAASPRVGGRPNVVSEGEAWQRQLQRAQSAGWFHRSDRLSAGNAMSDYSMPEKSERPAPGGSGPQGRDTAAPTLQLRGRAAAGASAATNAPHAAPLPDAGVLPSDPIATPIRLATPALTAAEGIPMTSTTVAALESSESPEPGPASRPAPARAPSPSFRIHIEEGSLGLQLWLGVHGTPAEVSARASDLAAQLRWQCARAGLRVASVTCNGAPVSDATQTRRLLKEET